MSTFIINAGHTLQGKGTGAVGFLNESKENVAVYVDDITKTQITTQDGTTYVISDGYLDIGLIDTMEDLTVNFIGALIYCVIGFFYVKDRDKYSIASKFIVQIKEDK